jgi:hypothetical protein
MESRVRTAALNGGIEQSPENAPRADFMERHFTVLELAKAWHMGERTVRFWFMNEPGVIKYGRGKLVKGRQRTHLSLRIPESVARRVYRRRTGRELA